MTATGAVTLLAAVCGNDETAAGAATVVAAAELGVATTGETVTTDDVGAETGVAVTAGRASSAGSTCKASSEEEFAADAGDGDLVTLADAA